MSTPRPLDRLNPVTRLLAAVVLSIPLVVTIDWVTAATSLACVLVLCVACRVDLGLVARRPWPLAVAGVLGATSMALYGKSGGQVFWHFGPARVSENSLRLALGAFVRCFAMAVPALVLFTGVDATRMADGLSQVLRLPSRFVLGSLAGFRMTSLLAEDWRQIARARHARGLADDGRFRRWWSMSFALLVLAIRRGVRLATAMEARGFGAPTPRTWARASQMGVLDALALLAVALVDVVALVTAVRMGTLVTLWS